MKNLWSIQVSGSKVLDPGPFEARGNFSLRRICSNAKGRIVILSSMQWHCWVLLSSSAIGAPQRPVFGWSRQHPCWKTLTENTNEGETWRFLENWGTSFQLRCFMQDCHKYNLLARRTHHKNSTLHLNSVWKNEDSRPKHKYQIQPRPLRHRTKSNASVRNNTINWHRLSRAACLPF